ncbi:Retrovirus-related Pol polyprotein from transposon TNT 1-94 [Gossypium australe]|uniref:Retrovirus-related Pol polyprotein from transposon TNT 1-94 n=1 Tax=Gossypium australe TaxID=47621 RepID=A0A5B6WI43_9ROSI|nr:Retrovirus-related Pol polyprotein from transposon TNT 1-94 [Gossypium australe]
MEMTRCLLHDKGLPKKDKLDKKVDARIFVGYNSSSKAYRIYLPKHNKVIINRDVQFHESDNANKKIEFHEEDDDIDDEPIRGTQSLSKVHQKCNVAIMELEEYEKVAANKKIASFNEGRA